MNEPSATRPDAPATASLQAADEISLWEVLAVVVRRRGTIVLATILGVALAIAVTLLRADQFTSQASFRPQGSETSSSQLMALASQFGVAVPGGGSSEEASPAFYAELLTSRQILSAIAVKPYRVEGVGNAFLKDLLEIEERTEPLRDEETIRWLAEEGVSVTTGAQTGTVTVSVRTEWPEVSVAIAQDLLDGVSRFNLDTRQSQAASERAFIESRVEEAKKELGVAEDSLRLFLEANRQYQNSPMLQFVHEGLDREVMLRQSVLTTLVQSYEQARISEVRDTPVITVLLTPFLPPGPDERSLLLAAVLGVILGGVTGIVLAFMLEAVQRPVTGDPAREDFLDSWNGLLRSIPLVGRRAAGG